MNKSDGGKNRVPMKRIGEQGLEKVLRELREWKEGMTVAEARERLWEWRAIAAQQTLLEELCSRHGVILLYNPKAHPQFSPIERLWRYLKYRTDGLFDLGAMIEVYHRQMAAFIGPNQELLGRVHKWFDRCYKYMEWYARGGLGYIRDSQFRLLEFDELPRPLRTSRLGSYEEVKSQARALNWDLKQGKKKPKHPQPFG